MKRSGRLSRKRPLDRSGPLRPKARTRKERERVYGTEARQTWLRERGCLACGQRPVELAHVENGGMGRKANADRLVPLCATHHRMQHALGVESFDGVFAVELRGVSLKEWATRYDESFRAFMAEDNACA